MPHTGEIGAERGTAELIERRSKRACCGFPDDSFKLRQEALAVGLPQWDETRAGRDPVRHDRMEEGMNGGRERNRVRRSDKTHRNRIDNRSLASVDRPVELRGR